MRALTTLPAKIPLSSLAAWSLQGQGARDFLQGYVSSDLASLPRGRWQVTAFCTIKGRVLATAYVSGSADKITFLMPGEMIDPVLASLKRYLAFARRCELNRSSERVLAVLGEAGGMPVDIPGTKPLALTLVETEARLNSDEALWRFHEIEAGFAQVTQPVSEAFLPQMIGLDKLGAVNYQKGCYLGQEVIARAAHKGQVKRRLQRLTLASDIPVEIGQKLCDADGRERAVVVACAPNPEKVEEISVLAAVSGEPESPLLPCLRPTT